MKALLTKGDIRNIEEDIALIKENNLEAVAITRRPLVYALLKFGRVVNYIYLAKSSFATVSLDVKKFLEEDEGVEFRFSPRELHGKRRDKIKIVDILEPIHIELSAEEIKNQVFKAFEDGLSSVQIRKYYGLKKHKVEKIKKEWIKQRG